MQLCTRSLRYERVSNVTELDLLTYLQWTVLMKHGDTALMRVARGNNVQVVAATNRIDILDPALLRSGRLDRKIEFPHPTEEARARILQIHSRKMNVSDDVNYEELARCTDDFNGAQLKVCSFSIFFLCCLPRAASRLLLQMSWLCWTVLELISPRHATRRLWQWRPVCWHCGGEALN